MSDADSARRAFVAKALYVAPAILTLAAAPSFAKAGSEKDGRVDRDHGGDDSGWSDRDSPAHRRHPDPQPDRGNDR